MIRRMIVLFSLLTLMAAAGATQASAAKYPPRLTKGSTGWEVKDLQFRLHTLGYLNVEPTAYFGTLTRSAVQRFQKKSGLPATGVADLKTWKQLKRKSLSKKDLALLARVIHGEARGERYVGQVAVGAVVLNRLGSPSFPKTLQGVIMQRNAFSAVHDGQFSLSPNSSAFKAAEAAVRGWDPTGNALYYYNPDISSSKWMKQRVTTKRIGNHVFKV